MADFDPDKYLREKTAGPSGFDPDKYLAEKTPAPEESFGRQLTRGALDTVLPIGGAIGAAALAGPETMGLGSIPAGAAGWAGGQQLSRILKNQLLGDDIGETSLSGMAGQTAQDLIHGATAEAGGQVVGKATEMAAPYLSKGVGAASDALGSVAERQMAKGIGAGAKAFEDPEMVGELGRYALDNDLAGPFTTAPQGLAKAKALQSAAEDGGALMPAEASFVPKDNRWFPPIARETPKVDTSQAMNDYKMSGQAADLLKKKAGQDAMKEIDWSPTQIIPSTLKKFGPNTDAGLAKGADWLSETLKTAPQSFGKFANALTQAAARGPQGLAATNFVLQQTNPEYRETIKNINNPNGDQQ